MHIDIDEQEEILPYVHSHTEEAFLRYFNHGLEPGSFGLSMLCNDIEAATARADHWNKPIIPNILKWLELNAPQGSWGSWEIVYGWLNKNEFYEMNQKSLVFEILKRDENENH